MAKERPKGTELADGRFGAFLGAKPNGEYATGGVLASYVDPALPWPATVDTRPLAGERAMALARVFHRGHAGDYLSGGPYLYQPGPGTPDTLARTCCP